MVHISCIRHVTRVWNAENCWIKKPHNFQLKLWGGRIKFIFSYLRFQMNRSSIINTWNFHSGELPEKWLENLIVLAFVSTKKLHCLHVKWVLVRVAHPDLPGARNLSRVWISMGFALWIVKAEGDTIMLIAVAGITLCHNYHAIVPKCRHV